MAEEAAAAAQDNTEEAGENEEAVAAKAAEEAKAAEDAKAAEAKVAEEEAAAAKNKEYALKLEEGSSLSASDIDRISTLAKEKGLSEEDAKELVTGQEAAVRTYKDAQMQEVEDVRTGWSEASKSDKEFGGEKFDENMGVAKTAIDKFGSPEFKQALEDTGFGNHPEVVRVFYRIGEAMANDKLVTAESQVGGKKETADVLYHTSAEKS